MLSRRFLPLALTVPSLVVAMKTSIYIDQIPLYSKLPECAMERMSAIVRAQASGCGDAQQLTSFSCFCIDQSTMMSSIISTAVEASCAARATVSITSSGTLPEVTSAIEVFDSYCARSTELALYKQNSTPVITITEALTSTPLSATTSASSSPTAETPRKTVPVVAIAAPVAIGVALIAGVVGFLFYLRQRRRATKGQASAQELPPNYSSKSGSEGYYGGELAGDAPVIGEMNGSAGGYRYELEDKGIMKRAELDGGK